MQEKDLRIHLTNFHKIDMLNKSIYYTYCGIPFNPFENKVSSTEIIQYANCANCIKIHSVNIRMTRERQIKYYQSKK
jgi:hypothetical protein